LFKPECIQAFLKEVVEYGLQVKPASSEHTRRFFVVDFLQIVFFLRKPCRIAVNRYLIFRSHLWHCFFCNTLFKKSKMARSTSRNKSRRQNRQDSGHPNHPNYGHVVSENSYDLKHGYGYNQAPNSASNAGGHAYGHNYGQYHQGSYNRYRSNPEEYEGEFYPGYDDEGDDYNQWEDRPMRFGTEEVHGPYMVGYPPLNNDIDYGADANAYGHRHTRYDHESIYSNNYIEDDEDEGYDVDHEYRHRGYQTYGQTEGFGWRERHRNEGNWEDKDEYRGGHAQRRRAFGKYGSR
jgi:hypothetical protein